MRSPRWLQVVGSARPDGVGVADWSLYLNEGRRLTLQTKDRETGNAHVPFMLTDACGGQYVIRWEDGLVSRGSLERPDVEEGAVSALLSARAAAYDDPDAGTVLGPAGFAAVELHDAGTARVAAGDTNPLVDRWRLVQQRVREGGFGTWSGAIHASAGEARVVTSRGLDAMVHTTQHRWHISIDGEAGAGHSARAFEPLNEFSARLERLAGYATLLGRPTAPMAGGVHDVILHPDVVEDLVLATLLHHLDASTVAHGEGYFRRDQFGSAAPALREDLRLRLDPLLPLRSGSYRFTREGLPAKRCMFIDRGRLVTPVAGLKYARRLGIPPTPIPYGLDTLFVEGPERISEQTAWAHAEGGALILNVLGVHTLDPASGDFSLSAPQVLRLGARGPEGRLRGTISGNLFRLLVSDSLRFVTFEGEHTPGLLIRCRLDPK